MTEHKDSNQGLQLTSSIDFLKNFEETTSCFFKSKAFGCFSF